MAIIALPQAEADIDEITEFLGKRRQQAPIDFGRALRNDLKTLEANPGFGSQIDDPSKQYAGLRRWPMTQFHNHVIYYRPIRNGIEVVRVLHGSRDRDTVLRKT